MTLRSPHNAGFTLIETMAAVFLTGLVIVVAVSFYIDVSRSIAAAVDFTQTGRRALGILDRVARDLEGAFLIEASEEADPLYHPWVFIAESRYVSGGSDQIHLISTTQRPRSRGQSGNLATVSYSLRADNSEDGGFDLIRRVVPGRPAEPPTDFPRGDEAGAIVLATDLASFSLRFQDEQGAMHDSWDSAQLSESGSLPTAVEIRVGILEETARESADDFADGDRVPAEFSRLVALPMRAMTMEELLGLSGLFALSQDNPEACEITLGQCVARQPSACQAEIKNAIVTSQSLQFYLAVEKNCLTGKGLGWPPCANMSLCGF